MKTSLLSAGCERAPASPNLNFVPANSTAYRVKTGDDWWKLASRPEVVAAGLDALGLCHFNFGTRVPAEINWYLRNKVGCVQTTRDKKNYVFSSDAAPGVVYLPRAAGNAPIPPTPSVPAAPAAPKDRIRLNSWVGFGGKFGSTTLITGIEQVGGYMISIEDLVNQDAEIRSILFNAQTTRLGVGIGASGGACIIYATSLRSGRELSSLMTGGTDYNVALGPQAGAFLKLARLKKVKPIVDVLVKIGAKSPAMLQAALKAPDKLADLQKATKALQDTIGSEVDAVDPSITIVDVIGLSGGTEVSFFHGVTEYRVLGEPTISIQWENGPS